jgi:hypothetical protein
MMFKKNLKPMLFCMCAILLFSALILNFDYVKTLCNIDYPYLSFYKYFLIK